MSRTTDTPIGFGRRGARVENTPRETVSRKGTSSQENPRERWNAYIRMRWEKPPISFSPRAYASCTSTVPRTPAPPGGWMGIPAGSVNGVWIVPTGANVMDRRSSSMYPYAASKKKKPAGDPRVVIKKKDKGYKFGVPLPPKGIKWTGQLKKRVVRYFQAAFFAGSAIFATFFLIHTRSSPWNSKALMG